MIWWGVRGRLRESGARDGWLAQAEERMFEGNARELYDL